MAQRAIFLDRDGVINIDHGYVYRPEDFTLIDGVLSACAKFVAAGWVLVVITNQSGIGRGYYSESDFSLLTEYMKKIFADAEAPISKVYFCPHHPEKAQEPYRCHCACRKPEPGMILQAQTELNIDLSASIMVGDKPSDMKAAQAAGIPQRILVGTNGEKTPELIPPATHVARSLAQASHIILG